MKIKQDRFLTTRRMVMIALMASVICTLSPLCINLPVSPVPISLATMAVCLASCILGWRSGTFSVVIYLLLGLAGLPVFSNFTGGIAKLAGPTGGYLIGYLFLALISGFFFENTTHPALHALGMALGTGTCYGFGTLWLSHQAGLTFLQGLAMGVIPYIPGDLAKIMLVLVTGPAIKRRLAAAGLR
ncbi:MAG: biotin transporter BioY [Eubacterium sp.]|nr:biotin transporter BioY [Eubacterium sp.]